jgi:hypothetical protein
MGVARTQAVTADRLRNDACTHAGQTHDADTAGAGGGGDCRYGV